MNQFPTFRRILVNCLSFVLGILWPRISDWDDRPLMKKSKLSALPIFLLDKPIFEITRFGQVAFQSVSELFVDIKSQPSEIVSRFRCYTVVFVKAGNHRVVLLQLYELCIF